MTVLTSPFTRESAIAKVRQAEFDTDGLMQRRFASISDLSIAEADRKLHWPSDRGSDDHPGLSDLDL